MSKDDYPVIVYQILSYLYMQLKRGEAIDAELLKPESPYLRINELYWEYVMINLQEEGYIKGLTHVRAHGGDNTLFIQDIAITPKGIEYLTENSFINKAKKFLQDTKSIVPFV